MVIRGDRVAKDIGENVTLWNGTLFNPPITNFVSDC